MTMVLKPKTNKLNNIIIIDDDSKSIEEPKKYKMRRNYFTNEYKIKFLNALEDKDIYEIFHELIKKVKSNRKLRDNDRIRIVIQNEMLPHAIPTKFHKLKAFKFD